MPTPFAMSLTGIGANAVGGSAFAASSIAPMNIGNTTVRSDGALAQTGVLSLFTIGTAPIWLFAIYGQIGTVIQTQANATKLQAKATGQTAVDLCATLDITAKAASSLLGITGTAANAMVNGFALPGMVTPWLILPGTIDLNCAASNTGTVRWSIHWVPSEPGATCVTA